MDEITSIFQNIAFPVAVCAVLFYALYFIIKSGIRQNDDAVRIVKEAQQQHLDYLQSQNERLSQIICDCTKALNENTLAFKKLLFLLEQKKVPD